MAAWLLVGSHLRLLLALCLAAGVFSLHSSALLAADGQKRQNIRFYKVNKDGITMRIQFAAKKGRKTGCHNFLNKRRVFQANQFGFSYCRLYSKKDCAEESLIEVVRAKDAEPVTDLSQGYSWLPLSDHERGVKLRSWNCQS